MGEIWWALAICAAMTAAVFALATYGMLNDKPDPNACPECGHESGLNTRSSHCGGQDDHNGWASDLCKCQNDWHWNYESTTT